MSPVLCKYYLLPERISDYTEDARLLTQLLGANRVTCSLSPCIAAFIGQRGCFTFLDDLNEEEKIQRYIRVPDLSPCHCWP
jgi:hypothetical protein